MNKTINPELMLAAARMADPTEKWVIVGNCVAFDISTTSENYDQWRYFNPLTSDDDAMKLERALKKEHEWNFSYERDEFQAWREHSKPIMVGGFPGQEISTELLSDDSDTLLLLKCVSAQTGIPLYLEDKQ